MFFLPNIIRIVKSRWERLWDMQDAVCRILVVNLKMLFGTPIRKWQDNIKINLK